MSEVIRDKDGRVIQRSRNLAGIRRYVGKNLIKRLRLVHDDATGEGVLAIVFENQASFRTVFASYNVLKGWVRRWRNVYGAPLLVNGKWWGAVSYNNIALIED